MNPIKNTNNCHSRREVNAYRNRAFHGFTLVELIVVITILVILGTIAFISLSGFSGNARDSSRVSDFSNISKGLDINYIKNGSYPNPDSPFLVTYSGGHLWAQGTIGDTVINILGSAGTKMSKKPTDPLTTTKEYTYSKISYGNAYELKTDWEGDSVVYRNNFVSQTYASSGNPTLSYIKGTYNGMVAKTKSGNIIFLVAVPSIITTQSGELNAKAFIIHGQTNSGGLANAVNPSKLLIYSGSSLPLSNEEKILFASGIALAYSGTALATQSSIKAFIDAGTNTEILASLGGELLSASLAGNTNTTNHTPSPPLSPSLTYTTGNDAYINRSSETTAQIGSTLITWNTIKHWWERTNDGAVLIPDKTIDGLFNNSIIEGTVRIDAPVANGATEIVFNKDQTNNLFVSPKTAPAYTYCKLLNIDYTGTCNDAITLTIKGGFQGTDPTLPTYHSGYITHGDLSYAGTAIYAGSEQFTPTVTSKTSTSYTQYISRQSYNSNTSYCETTYGTGWRLPTDYETGHRNDTTGIITGNGWNPAYTGLSGTYFWTSSRDQGYAYFRWLFNLTSTNWTHGSITNVGYQVRCVFFPR